MVVGSYLPKPDLRGCVSADMTAGAAEAESALSGDPLAARLRGFGPVGIIAAILILLAGNIFIGPIVVPLGATLALIWVRLSRTPWREIGYARPRSWALAVAGGFAFGIGFKLLMK